MKKFLSFMILLAGVISITSCSDDDFTYTAAEPLEIRSAEVIFEAVGGEGYIQVGETGNISAETSSSWLQLEVNGQQVKVTAAANPVLEGRSASIVVKSGNKTATVTATQTGAVLKTEAPESIVYDDEAHTASYSFSCSIPATVTTSAPWLKAELVDDQLVVSVEANNEGNIRTGYVYCKAGVLGSTTEIIQGEIDKDVVGKYYVFGGVDPDEQNPEEAEVAFLTTITKEGNAYSFTFPSLGLSMPVTFNKAKLTMTLAGGQRMGTYGPYYVYSLIADATEGYVTWNTAVTMTANLKQYKETDEDGTYTYMGGLFKDDGKWSGYASDTFALGAFKTDAASSANSNFAGTLAFFTNVIIMDYEVQAAAKGAGYAKTKKRLERGLALSKKFAPVAE